MRERTGTVLDEGLPAPCWAAAPLSVAAAHTGVSLKATELDRAAGYLPGRPREDFVAGRVLVRALAAELLNRTVGMAPELRPGELELIQHCPTCGSSQHGPPRLRWPKEGLMFSVSYARTAGWLLLGLAPASLRIGVDLADQDDPVFEPVDGDTLFEDYAYAPVERRELDGLPAAERPMRRARWWALKEAVAKAAGEGIAGTGGIPVVVGQNRHLLLRSPGARAMALAPGTPDSLGNVLPENLVGGIVWAPD